ncbi:uncharacterized protein LOC144168737 [Haemaphysalis longicornis]
MCARSLRAVFLQRLQVVTAFHRTYNATCFLVNDVSHGDGTCPASIDARFPQALLDLPALPAVEDFACWQPRPSEDGKLVKLLLLPANSGSGATMCARSLRAVFLQRLQVVTAFHRTYNATCFLVNDVSHGDGTCPASIDARFPQALLDLPALPAVEDFACWQPRPSEDGKLVKLLLLPANLGSGATMCARSLRAVFLQRLQVVTAFHRTYNATCFLVNDVSHGDGTCPASIDARFPQALLDLPALPAVEDFACWQPRPSEDGKLVKLLLLPANSGSGATIGCQKLTCCIYTGWLFSILYGVP